MDKREQNKDQRTIESKRRRSLCPETAGRVSSRCSSFGPGSPADVVEHNGSALGCIPRKWGELTLNPEIDAIGYTKKTAQTSANELGSRPPRLSPGSEEHLFIRLSLAETNGGAGEGGRAALP